MCCLPAHANARCEHRSRIQVVWCCGSVVALGLAVATPTRAEHEIQVPPTTIAAADGGPGIDAVDGRNVHNAGNIWLNVTNFGLIGSQPGTRQAWSESPSAQWPAPSRTEHLFGAGLWVGARRHGVAQVSTAQPELEFRAPRGPLGRMYAAREGDSGAYRAPSLRRDDDGDGAADEDPLDGRDNDGDGRIDEDFAAISTQMFTCEYNDSDPAIAYQSEDHQPLGLVIRQTSMTWDGAGRRDCIAFDFRITTTEFLQDVYVGLFADADIGPPEATARAFDDLAGFWEGEVPVRVRGVDRMVPVSMGYMWDADQDGIESEGWIGLVFLGHERNGFGTSPSNRRVHPLPLRNFRSFSGRAPFIAGGDPGNDFERYDVLSGTARGSLAAGFRRDARATVTPNDYRFVISAGPFAALTPGDTLGITAALVIGRGFEGVKRAAVEAQLAFDGAWANCDGDFATGVDGRETPHCGPEETGLIYPIRGPDGTSDQHTVPCDSLCQDIRWWTLSRCSVAVPPQGCAWIDGDCDRATGIDGNECLVHWFSDVAPPAPHLRIAARENHVDVIWDNHSERVADPVLGFSDFESYRVWRSDDWRRPPGSDLDTGPDAGRWMLLGEFDVRGNGVGVDVGFESVRYTPRVPPNYIALCSEWIEAHPEIEPPLPHGLTVADRDTAIAMARGARYYVWTDPPFLRSSRDDDPPCGDGGRCDPVQFEGRETYRRCDERGRCRPAADPPRTGAHYFYSVTATDHRMTRQGPSWVATGAGLSGHPSTNHAYICPPSDALQPRAYPRAAQEIYVVPNPATPRSMAQWALAPNNEDPTGTKIEFHHLPAAQGMVTIFTLSGDMVERIAFDGRGGNGTAAWDLVNRNGQEVTSGVYLFTVEADAAAFERFIGKFVVVR